MSGAKAGRFQYFAYGSNLHPQRLLGRAPSARVEVTAVLPGHLLRFHKLGRDGSAKCNAYCTGDSRHRVHGAVYSIDERHRSALDRAESCGVGYDARVVSLLSGGHHILAMTYIARQSAVKSGIRPFDWYLDFVLTGARYHDLPEDYMVGLAETGFQPDSDPERSALNYAIMRHL